MRYVISMAGVALLTLLGLTGAATSASAEPHIATEGWYGYAVTGSTYTSSTADWTVPALTCSATLNDTSVAIWTGLDGYSSPTTEQIGIVAECVAGKESYLGFYDLYPNAAVDFSNTVKPGDQLDASVSYSGSSFTLKLSDLTQGWTQTVTKTLAGADRSSAETIVEAPSTLSCTPHVTLAAITGDTVDGKALASLSPVVIDAGNPNIVLSAVSSEGFSVTCT